MKKTCKCGFNKSHPEITHKSEYTKFGWFLLTILGMSAKPQSVKFYCTKCDETIDVSTDPEILSKYIGR